MTVNELKNAILALRSPRCKYKALVYLVLLALKGHDERSTQSIARDLRCKDKQVLYGLAEAEKGGLIVSRLDKRDGKWWRLTSLGMSEVALLLAKVHGF